MCFGCESRAASETSGLYNWKCLECRITYAVRSPKSKRYLVIDGIIDDFNLPYRKVMEMINGRSAEK